MTKPYFAWVAAGTVFSPSVHNVEDLELLDLVIEHKEGQFPTAEIVVKGPQIALLAPGREVWCWISWDNNGTAEAIFHGRLVALPTDITKEAVTLNFIAEPEDYALQQDHIAQGLKLFTSNYDPIFLDDQFRDDGNAILEGFSARWHISRADLQVSVSDILIGEDSIEVFTEDEIPYDSLDIHVGTPPITAVAVDASVGWSNASEGTLDIGTFRFTTLNGDALMGGWPKTGQNIGGGWTVEVGTAFDRRGTSDIFNVQFHYNYQNKQKVHTHGDTMSQSISASFPVGSNVAAISQTPVSARINRSFQIGQISENPDFHDIQPAFEKFNTFYVFTWEVDCRLVLRYAAGRDRAEHVRFTLASDLQSIVTLPHPGTPAATEKIRIEGADVALPVQSFSQITGLPFTPEPPPIIDPQRTAYFPTDRGRRSIEYLINRAASVLKAAARCVEISWDCTFERALALSCRKSARITERRVGTADGKIIAYRIEWHGDDTTMFGNITMGCAIGRGGFAFATLGDPSYAAPGYMAPGYQVYYNNFVPIGLNAVSYSVPAFAVNDDGMQFPLTAAQVVLSQVVNNVDPIGLQQVVAAAASAGRTGKENPSIDEQIAAHNNAKAAAAAIAAIDFGSFFDLQLKPVDKEGFEASYDITVTTLQLPMMIDLGEGPSTSGAVPPPAPPPPPPPVSGPTTAPSISRVTDDVGVTTGIVSSGGTTDDTAPVVRVNIAGTGAIATDTVQLFNTATAVGSPVVLSGANISAGFVDIATTLSNAQTYVFNATITNQFGTSGHSVANYTVTIDTVGGVGGGGTPSTGLMIGVCLAGCELSWHNYPNMKLPGIARSENADPAIYDFAFSSHAEIDYYNAKGMKLIRQGFLWERLQRPLGAALDARYLAMLSDMVNYATGLGIKVVLNCHNYMQYLGGAQTGTLSPSGNADVSAANLADLWGKIAAVYGGNSNVLFNLMNEPHMDPPALIARYNPTIAAIRGAGANNRLWIEGNNNYGPSVGINQTVLMPGIVDSANNWVYSTHMYADPGHSGASTVISTTEGVTELTPLTTWARSNGKKLVLGEHGVGTESNDLAELNNTMAFIKANEDVWEAVAYWAGGPIWNLFGYRLSCEPAAGVDKPQMPILQAYL